MRFCRQETHPNRIASTLIFIVSCHHIFVCMQVGFMYGSLLEDFLTSLTLHCKGWKSVYLNPPRPQFLGNTTTNLNDLLVHGSRGSQGLVEVGMSKFCPLIYGPSCRLSLLQTMAYAEFALFPLFEGLAILCFATIPPLCLLNGITLYPQVRLCADEF